MKYFIAFLFLFSQAFAQTTTLTFPIIPTSAADLNRAGNGMNEWSYGQNDVNIPVEGTNTTRLDRYWRFIRTDIQPFNGSAGVYNWTLFDQKLTESIGKNQGFSFSIMDQCGGCDANLQSHASDGGTLLYPNWLHLQMQAEATTKDFRSGSEWVANPNSPAYLASIKQLHKDLYTHLSTTFINGVRELDVITTYDIRFWGEFGEWTENDYSSTGHANPVAANLDSIISYVIHGLETVKCVVMIAAYDAGFLQANTNNPPAAGWYALTAKNSAGLLGWRRDNWGWNDNYIHSWLENNTAVFNGMRFDTAIMHRYLYAPVIGEPADLGQAGDFTTMVAQGLLYHANSAGNGNLDNNFPPSTAVKNNFRAFSKNAGARIILNTGSMTTSLAAGGAFNISLGVQNVGVAPEYLPYTWTYELRTAAGVVVWKDSAAFALQYFFNAGANFALSSNFTLPQTVAAGNYNLYLIIRHKANYRKPHVLFITTTQGTDGSYLLRSNIAVASNGGGNPPPPPPPPPPPVNLPPISVISGPQAVTLPTSSVALSGTGSSDPDGHITAYLWARVSGPNTPTIGTSTASTSNITGLIVGTYIFSLRVTDDSATTNTNTWTVVVTAAPLPGTMVFTTQTPTGGTGNDGVQGGITGIELGMKFKSTIPGFITGAKFYKTTGNAGTHIGELYDSLGNRLAAATFTAETATGWQTVFFSGPVAINANQTYIVSYFSSLGNYTSSNNYFTTNIINTPMIGLVDRAPTSPNGIYKYTATAAYPTSTFNKSNYWVDAIFSPSTNKIIGTGSGAVSITSMTGYNPGDTVRIATQTGVYTTLTIQNTVGLTIIPASGRPIFQQAIICKNAGLDLSLLNLVSAGQTVGIDMTCGTEYGDFIHNIHGEGYSATLIDAGGGQVYTYADTNTYKWFRMTWDSLDGFRNGMFLRGSTGTTKAVGTPDVWSHTLMQRINDRATTATVNEGLGISGICFGCVFHDWNITSTTQRFPSGNVGYFNLKGWSTIYNVYKNGGPGYLAMLNPMQENRDPGDSKFYNNGKFNSTEYGMINVTANLGDTVVNQYTANSVYVFNNTYGNGREQAGLSSPLALCGQVGPGQHYYVKNNLAFNVGVAAGGNTIAMNNGQWTTMSQDTANNRYYKTATFARIDSTTINFTNSLGSFPFYKLTVNSPYDAFSNGAVNPLTSVDYVGNALRSPRPDVGYLQFIGVPPAIFGDQFLLLKGFKIMFK